jgi:hypothetical protein
MRLTGGARIGTLRLRRYQHARHGVVETLTQDTVVYVRPVFGVLKPHEEQQTELMGLRTQKAEVKQGHVNQSQGAPHRAR